MEFKVDHFFIGFEKNAGELSRAAKVINNMRDTLSKNSGNKMRKAVNRPGRKMMEIINGKDFKASIDFKRRFRKSYPNIWKQVQQAM